MNKRIVSIISFMLTIMMTVNAIAAVPVSGENGQNAPESENSEEVSTVGYIALAVSDNRTFAVKFTDYSGEYSVTYEQLKAKFKFIVD